MTSPQDIQVSVRPGDVLAGKYRVERVLGAGGMGVVVAAMHIQLEERVAIKFLLPQALQNPEAIARFDREARAAVKIKSEHVARVSDVGRLDTGAPYMVMEYLEGGDLAAWLKQRGPLPLDQAAEFILQGCEAIAEAHALGIVHRDLKPANLFCVRRADGLLSIKVLDFGISKVGGQGSTADMTRTAAVVGSPYYMSPEQMQSSKGVDARTDIWALGVILFELVTGRVPFDADAVTELAIKIATEMPPPVRALRGDLPAAFEMVVARCLEKDRTRRFQNVGELAVALADFAPVRARASVERTLRTLGVAGIAAVMQPIAAPVPASLSQAASARIGPSGTVSSWGQTGSGKKSNAAGIVFVVAAGLLAVLGGGLLAARQLSRGAAERAATAASAGPGASLPAAASLPFAASVTAAASLPSASSAPSEAPSVSVPATASVPPAPEPPPSAVARPTPQARPAGPPGRAVGATPAATPAQAAARPAAKGDCNPPYVIDSAGHRQYKPECL